MFPDWEGGTPSLPGFARRRASVAGRSGAPVSGSITTPYCSRACSLEKQAVEHVFGHELVDRARSGSP